MSIKLNVLRRDEEERAAAYIWTDETDPVWMRYQVTFANREMTGMVISRAEGSLPRAVPFNYIFLSAHAARTQHQTIANAIFADLSRETVLVKGDRVHSVDAARARKQDQAALFAQFLGGPAHVELTDFEMTGSRVIKANLETGYDPSLFRMDKDSRIVMMRGRNYRVGATMNGYDSYRIAMTKGLPRTLRIGAIGDPDVDQARAALSGVAHPSPRAVNWYGVREPELARIRRQAADAYPLLAGLIAESPSMSQAVDNRTEIASLIMDRTGLGKGALKAIGKLRVPAPAARLFADGEEINGEDALGVNRARHTRIPETLPVDMALRYLADLPPDRAPKDDKAWTDFNDILCAVAIPLHNATGISINRILEPAKGDWSGYRTSLARAADFAPENFDRRTMALTTIDALEAMDHFNRTAVLPQALTSIAEHDQQLPIITREFVNQGLAATMSLFLGQAKNIGVAVMEISRRYASRIPAMAEIEGGTQQAAEEAANRFRNYPQNGFPLMTDDFVASNGHVVRALRDGDALTEESRRLAHCVGGYQSTARNCRSHLYSVQNPEGDVSYSTFEIAGLGTVSAEDAIANMRTVQHRAYRNGTPSDDAQLAYREWLDAVKQGRLAVNWQEITDFREWMATENARERERNRQPVKSTITSWTSVLGFDWQNNDKRAAYWGEWGQVLGGRVARAETPAAVYGVKEAQELVASMSPRTAALMIDAARREKAAREAAALAAANAVNQPPEDEPDMVP